MSGPGYQDYERSFSAVVTTRQTWCLEVADIRIASPVVATILVVTHSA